MSKSRFTIAVFLSGGGRSLANLIQQFGDRDLPIDIRMVISSSATVRGVTIARAADIETLVVSKSEHPDPSEFRDAMFDPCRIAGVDLVVMAGFLKHVLIPDDFVGRVINIHPSLLPSFGGPGMYGHHVHQAVIDGGGEVSGCTVHYVDNQYDNGPILLQKNCPVKANDTPDTLAARVFQLECQALPEAIEMIAAKSLTP